MAYPTFHNLIGGDRQLQPLEQRKIDMHVQALDLESGEAVGKPPNATHSIKKIGMNP
jgi:hypothetical protein